MKVGDLVMLSSYGKARGYNLWLTKGGLSVGFVHKVHNRGHYPIKVKWLNAPLRKDADVCGHSRRELKYAHLAR